MQLQRRLLGCCCLCVINCVKFCIEWVTDWAYCHVAIYGFGFVAAGKQARAFLGSDGFMAIVQQTLTVHIFWLGKLVGAGLGVAMRGLSAYDSLKSEAMGHMAQAGNVAAATKRGLGYK